MTNFSGSIYKTIAGIGQAVERAIFELMHEGKERFVFMLARPGRLPDIRITVELSKNKPTSRK